jgi:zinc D-Ala-D-Ala carboxypeptidase
MAWDSGRWPNFSQQELSCKCGCGCFVSDEHALDCLQALRNEMGRLVVTSATRCEHHNAAEGGAPASEHLNGRAFDISLAGHDRGRMLAAARKCGFQGFGYGTAFLHVDTGRKRTWDYGAVSRMAWKGLI